MDDLFQENDASKSYDWTELARKYVYRARIVVKRFWWIVPLCLALGIAYKATESLLSEPVYKSTAQMILSGKIALPESTVYSEERDNFFGTQIALMTSAQVQKQAYERVRLARPDLSVSEVDLDASQKRGTSIFSITAYGTDPEFIQVYLDALMEEYISRRSAMRAETSEKTYAVINEELGQLEKEIEAGEDAIVEFQRQNNIVFIQEQGSAAGAYLSGLQRRLAELMTEQRILESIRTDEEIESLLVGTAAPKAAAANSGVKQDLIGAIGIAEENRKYLESREELDRLKAELEDFSAYLRARHPKIIDLKNQIERKENLIAIHKKQAFEKIMERKGLIAGRIANLNKEIEIWEKSALENGRLIAEFERLQSRLQRLKSAYERNQDTLRAIDSNRNLDQETVTVFEYASKARPARDGVLKQLALGSFFGFAMAGGILFVIGALDNRVLTASQLDGLFEEPLLGSIPAEDKKAGEVSVLLRRDDDRYVFAEACRNLRTSIFFMGEDDAKPKTILITSAVPSEGKSTVAANLAIALSFSKSKVLLVDADLRRGRLHHLFKLRLPQGLSDYLEGNVAFEDTVQHSGYDCLDFVSIGRHPEQPAELLMADRVTDFIEAAKERYDFVIFDSAPILATDDTSSFAGKLDAVLFTIRSAYTQVRQIRPAMARLRERNANISGLVLNYVDVSQPGYHYYRYSEYYTKPNRNKVAEEFVVNS